MMPSSPIKMRKFALLAKAGRPVPLAQLMGKLPAGVVVTEPMLRAAATQDSRLELKGPLLRLAEGPS